MMFAEVLSTAVRFSAMSTKRDRKPLSDEEPFTNPLSYWALEVFSFKCTKIARIDLLVCIEKFFQFITKQTNKQFHFASKKVGSHCLIQIALVDDPRGLTFQFFNFSIFQFFIFSIFQFFNFSIFQFFNCNF